MSFASLLNIAKMPSFIAVIRRIVLPLCLVGLSTTSMAVTIAATDSSWKVTASDPGVSALTSGSFDDSGWQSATVLYDISNLNYFPDAVAKGIWSSGGQFSTTETQIWARGLFYLSAVPLAAWLNSGFDDDGDLYINGVKVVSDHNGYANGSFVADLTPYLVAGNNLIAFTVTDNWPVWGYNHSAWAQIDGRMAAVPEPATLLLLGIGLIGMTLLRRPRA